MDKKKTTEKSFFTERLKCTLFFLSPAVSNVPVTTKQNTVTSKSKMEIFGRVENISPQSVNVVTTCGRLK